LDIIANSLTQDFDDFWNYNVFKNELHNENSKYILAKLDDNIVGFAGIWIALDEAHITNIVTKKSNRNQGVATLLLQELINMAKNSSLKSITLEVNEKNIPAIKLYEKFNFKKLGIRKKYYNNSENAIIMTLYLI